MPQKVNLPVNHVSYPLRGEGTCTTLARLGKEGWSITSALGLGKGLVLEHLIALEGSGQQPKLLLPIL